MTAAIPPAGGITLTIALAGQPNVGKSTVFNLLTGGTQYVSNWPGKTCDCQTGETNYAGRCITIVDLPGAYSLTAGSVEEQLARDALLHGRPDAVIVILDATRLERSLYLAAELLCLPAPLVLGLNRTDQAAAQGIYVESHVLAAAIGAPVVPIVASRRQGIEELIAAAASLALHPESFTPNRPCIRDDHRLVLAEIEARIAGQVPAPYPVGWVALKLLEGDRQITSLMAERMGMAWDGVYDLLRQHDDAFLAVAGGRYEWIGRMVRAAVVTPKAGQVTITGRIDRYATHPTLGALLLVAILSGLFWLTFAVGIPLQSWLEGAVVQAGASWARSALSGAPPWLGGLVANGLIGGVGTVLTLLPILLIFFLGLGLLEDVGYMARAAYVMDRWMHPMGLHGKSFLPLFLGFGCNVPAVMGTRMIESSTARLITVLVAPLAPCTARLSVIAMLAPIFFGPHAWWVTLALLGLPLVVLLVLGKFLHEALGGEHAAFIMELPLYQAPDLRSVGQGVWSRTKDFLLGAGSVILIVSVVLWALSSFPGGSIGESYLAILGRGLAPVGELMGLEWPLMVALMTSFLRKENTIPTLAVLYGAGENGLGLAAALGGRLVPAAALAFLAVQMLFIPCVATLAAIHTETRSWRWTAVSVVLLLAISLAAGIGIYQAGRLLGWGV